MSNNKLFKKFEKELKEMSEMTKNQDMLSIIYNMQCSLMKRYGHDPNWLKEPLKEIKGAKVETKAGTVHMPSTFEVVNKEERTKLLLDMVHCLDSEVSELRDGLPWKHWKNYKEQEMWYNDEDKKAYLGFEAIDILHFLMETFILLGYDAEDILKLYMVKNVENFKRQDVGYDDNYKE